MHKNYSFNSLIRILITLLSSMLIFQSSYADDWIKLVETEKATYLYNGSNINNEKINGIDSIGVWEKVVFKKAQNTPFSDTPIKSIIFLKWYQCKSRMASDSSSQYTAFDKTDAKVDSATVPLNSIKFLYAVPDSEENFLMNLGCLIDFALKTRKAEEEGASEEEKAKLIEEYSYYLEQYAKSEVESKKNK